MSGIERVTIEATVCNDAPNPQRLGQAMVESTTEYDYAELPDDLRAALDLWCGEFIRWGNLADDGRWE